MTMELDIKALRAETPGCAQGLHFNHSGASLMTTGTLAAITGHLQREAMEGPMEAAAGATAALDSARADAAALLGADPSNVAFAGSASAAFGLTFAALPRLKAGDRILVGRQEWGGNLATFQVAAGRVGAHVEQIPCRDDGSVDPDGLAGMIDARVRLISLTWLPANGGLINDAAAVGRIARAAGIPYFIDAGQALGQLPVDVAALGCDMLKGTARKFLRGPRGTALLYLRPEFMAQLEPAFLDVLSAPWGGDGPKPRADARLFETSEAPVALLLGMGASLRQARLLGIDRIRARIGGLATSLRAQLGDVPGVSLHDLGGVRSGLVSFTVAGIGAQDVRERLAAAGIAVGANGVPYTPLDMTSRQLREIVRASVHYINTDEEIAQLVGVVAAVARDASRRA